jgi:hypothetical protein
LHNFAPPVFNHFHTEPFGYRSAFSIAPPGTFGGDRKIRR